MSAAASPAAKLAPTELLASIMQFAVETVAAEADQGRDLDGTQAAGLTQADPRRAGGGQQDR